MVTEIMSPFAIGDIVRLSHACMITGIQREQGYNQYHAVDLSKCSEIEVCWKHRFRKHWSLPVGPHSGCIRLPVSTAKTTYKLSGMTHVTPLRKYGKHSTWTNTYGPWVRTYSKLFSWKSVLMVCSYRAQSNENCTRVSRGSLARVRRYGLLYLWTVEYDQCFRGR